MLLKIQEVCERLRVSRSTIERWERAGKFPQRINASCRVVRYAEADVTAWIESRQRGIGRGA